jgi:rhodanese-related sulfurtransferase
MVTDASSKVESGAPADEIAHDDLVRAVEGKSVAVVDVREPNEFAGGHIPGAINLPLSQFQPEQLPQDQPVVLVCQSGRRSGIALRQAEDAGVTGIRHYAGGTKGWRERGAPVEG